MLGISMAVNSWSDANHCNSCGQDLPGEESHSSYASRYWSFKLGKEDKGYGQGCFRLYHRGLAVDIIILGIWFGTDPFRWTTSVIATDFNGIILQAVGQCSSDGENSWAYPMVIVLLHLLLLVYANVLAFQTRQFHQISDSKMAAVSVFNSIQLLILATIMVAMSGNNVSIAYIIKACYAFLNNFGVVALSKYHKLWYVSYTCYTYSYEISHAHLILSFNSDSTKVVDLLPWRW